MIDPMRMFVSPSTVLELVLEIVRNRTSTANARYTQEEEGYITRLVRLCTYIANIIGIESLGHTEPAQILTPAQTQSQVPIVSK